MDEEGDIFSEACLGGEDSVGEKKVEFRKSVCTESVERILLYETSPVRKVTGEVSVDVIVSGTLEEVWEKLGDKAGIRPVLFEEKTSGSLPSF